MGLLEIVDFSLLCHQNAAELRFKLNMKCLSCKFDIFKSQSAQHPDWKGEKISEEIFLTSQNIARTALDLKRMFQAKYNGRLPFTDFSQRHFFYIWPSPFSVSNIARIANPATPRGTLRGSKGVMGLSRKSQGLKGIHSGSRGSRGTFRGSAGVKGTHRGLQGVKGGIFGVPEGVKKDVLGVKGDKGDI